MPVFSANTQLRYLLSICKGWSSSPHAKQQIMTEFPFLDEHIKIVNVRAAWRSARRKQQYCVLNYRNEKHQRYIEMSVSSKSGLIKWNGSGQQILAYAPEGLGLYLKYRSIAPRKSPVKGVKTIMRVYDLHKVGNCWCEDGRGPQRPPAAETSSPGNGERPHSAGSPSRLPPMSGQKQLPT